MSWCEANQIWSQEGRVVINLCCGLDSKLDVNEVINELVKAKNLAFPSGQEVYRKQMEALGGDVHDRRKTKGRD